MKFFFIFLVLICDVLAVEVEACQPCATTLTLAETSKQSDLIIIGQKIKEGPSSDFLGAIRGPDWIDIKVIRVLKGKESQEVIRVNSWDGMCSFGIAVNDKTYLIFLQKRIPPATEDYQYDAVNQGCSVKVYQIEDNDQVDVDGRKIPLDDFVGSLSVK